MIAAGPAAADNYMLQVEVQGRRVEGRPLFFSSQVVQLLLRDGQLFEFAPNQAKNFQRSAPTFRSYSAGEMRQQLAGELGRSFEVSGTGHYLVAHPVRQKDLWAQRFEELYRDFIHYWSVRGLRLHEPEFPLVAVVWPDQASFARAAIQKGIRVGSGTLGYYSPTTNRVSLFDTAVGQGDRADWQQNAATIIHEVTHQTAFNTGVHTRFAETPRWAAEGLGMLFEAAGVHSSRAHPRQRDRVNPSRLAAYRRYESEIAADSLLEMIVSDRVFDRQFDRAYAQAWALTFYLVETQPRRYTQYLAKTAGHEPGQPVSTAQRLADFTSVFGDNFRMLEARFERFMAKVK